MMGVLVLFIFLMFVVKRRQDRNEPVFGWRRKQFLEETGAIKAGNNEKGIKQPNVNPKELEKDKAFVRDLIGLENIEHGIYSKKNNEYSVIIEAESVNFDLLSVEAQKTTLFAYSALWRVIRFPLQILGQAVRQDLRKEERRWKENLTKCNAETQAYNNEVIQYIKQKSEKEFRISRKIYYVVSYVPQPSKMGSLRPEQRELLIKNEMYARAATVMGQLRQANVQSILLDSIGAAEVMKRALNRDRMVINPMESLITYGQEKLSLFVTANITSLPGFDSLVYPDEIEEVQANIEEYEQELLLENSRIENTY